MELWELMDSSGNKTGELFKRGEPLGTGKYHLVVHIWLINKKNELLIQQRSKDCDILPGVWACTSGSAIAGEDSITAAQREVREELGVSIDKNSFELIRRLKRRNTFVDMWIVSTQLSTSDMKLQASEVNNVRFASFDEITDMIDDGKFHNYGQKYFFTLGKYLLDKNMITSFPEEY